jgi:hypothetical protein
MASYTDAIMQFNPYVQQLPVELMMKVGMQKQAQYDAGVQKIQSHIDNISGLDVMHESDKEYIQSKLGQLNTKLKTVAAGDFSNQQLVNSVSGMTGSIIKDPNVQNAISSTSRYKKEKDVLDKAYKDGKSSIANVDDFDTQAQKWLSKKEAGQVFAGRYTPYIDVEKHNLEVFKALHASETGKDFVNERFTDPITGKLLDSGRLAAAMEREGVEGVSAAKIENALRSSYTPDILNQMRIDANFQFKGVTPEKLTENATRQYKNATQRADEEIERLQGIAELSGAQPVLQKRALDSIVDLKKRKIELLNNYNDQVKNIIDNPERAKVEIYKEGTIDQFANAFSWEKRTTQVLSNPQLQGQLAIEDNQIAKANLRLSQRGQTWQEYMDNRKQVFEEMKDARDNTPPDPFMTSLGEITKGLPAPLTAIAESTVQQGRMIESNIGILLNANPALKGDRAELQKRLVAFQNGDKTQFSADMRGTAQAIIDARKKVRENEKIEQYARGEIERDPEVATRKKELQKAVNTRTGLSLTANGKTEIYSPQEIYDLARKFQHITTETGGGSATAYSPQKGYYGIVNVNALTPKQRQFYEQYMNGSADLKKLLHGKIMGFSDIVEANKQFSTDVDNRINGLLAQRIGKFAPAVENLDATDAKKRSALESIVGSVLLRYDSGVPGLSAPGGDAFMSSGDRDKAKTWFSGEGRADLQYKTVTMGDNRYVLVMKGAESVMMKLTGMEASHPVLQSGIDRYGRSIQEKQVAFRGSTNSTGLPQDAEFGTNFFTNVKKYAVVADYKYDPQSPGVNYINLQIKLPSGWQPIQLDKPVDASSGRAFLSGMTDADIEKALKSKGIPIK